MGCAWRCRHRLGEDGNLELLSKKSRVRRVVMRRLSNVLDDLEGRCQDFRVTGP